MNKIRIGTNFAVFILFFGIAVIEAVESKNWLKCVLWLAIGVVFLMADNLKNKKNN